MKKLIFLVLALALFMPINASAYITFLAADQSVADDLDLIGFNLIDAGLPPASLTWAAYGTSALQFDANLPISAVGVSSALPFALYDSGTGAHGFVWQSGAIASPGILLSYSEVSTTTAPTLLSTLLVGNIENIGKYQLDFTYDFSAFTVDGDGSTSDAGALYTISQVPLPSAIFLLAPGLLALFGLRRRVAK